MCLFFFFTGCIQRHVVNLCLNFNSGAKACTDISHSHQIIKNVK